MTDNWNSTGDSWNDGNNGNWNGDDSADATNNFGNNVGNTGDYTVDGENASGAAGACRNCGQEGHFARECPEPRKLGPCFNCGEEGHSKAECTQPRVFKGACNICGVEGHPAAKCPSKPKHCTRCRQPDDHETKDCKNNFYLDLNDVADVTEAVAWSKIIEANHGKDIDDFKEGLRMLQKAAPELTYLAVEKKLRQHSLNNIFLIALEKDTGDGYTLVNLQGIPDQTYSVAVFKSQSCVRPSMLDKWPKDPEENLERLTNAGVPMERGVPYCRICEKFGHNSRECDQERVTVEGPTISCALCGEKGHRVRDCKEERKKPREPRTCKTCGSEDHIAKECDQKPKFTCRNCGGEDHKAAECTEPRKMICNNCDQEGHMSKECEQPKDWSRVTCRHCGEKGHAAPSRCAPGAAEEFAAKKLAAEAVDGNYNNDVGTFNGAAGDAGNDLDANANNGGWDGNATAIAAAAVTHNEGGW